MAAITQFSICSCGKFDRNKSNTQLVLRNRTPNAIAKRSGNIVSEPLLTVLQLRIQLWASLLPVPKLFAIPAAIPSIWVVGFDDVVDSSRSLLGRARLQALDGP
jgi:hypothetical protein